MVKPERRKGMCRWAWNEGEPLLVKKLTSERKWMVVDGTLYGKIEPFDETRLEPESVTLLNRPNNGDWACHCRDMPLWLWEELQDEFPERHEPVSCGWLIEQKCAEADLLLLGRQTSQE
jgi:hypothetical protein